LGERLAARHLERRGWTILARNFRFHRKEIDLIARRGEVLAFVEVKSRRGTDFGHPLEAITWRKRREIHQVAEAWLRRGSQEPEVVRFDAVSVIWQDGEAPLIEHVEDAWRLV
jgi:putative endonuclease